MEAIIVNALRYNNSTIRGAVTYLGEKFDLTPEQQERARIKQAQENARSAAQARTTTILTLTEEVFVRRLQSVSEWTFQECLSAATAFYDEAVAYYKKEIPTSDETETMKAQSDIFA